MKWLTTSLLVCLSLSISYAHEYRNLLQKEAAIDQLKPALIHTRQWVSYPAYTDRDGWNTLTGNFKEELIKKGESALNYEWKVVKATDYLEFEKSGSRRIMEIPFTDNITAFSNLIMAELAEGKGRFIPQIANGAWMFCEMTSWALSAHISREQTEKTSLPSHKQHIIDLTAGDLGSLLAWTLYFLEDELHKIQPLIPERLRSNLQDRILKPFMERDDFWWQAFNASPRTMVNNWNPWCNFNVLTCFLLLENDPDKLAAAVHRTMVSTDKFINYNHEDGACEEGPSYWGHAAGKMYDYLQLLHNATGGKVSIFDAPIIRNMGEYIARSYIGDGWVVNFADASAKGGGDKGVIFRYGEAVGSQEMKHFAAYLHQQDKDKPYPGNVRDIFRNLENLTFHNDLIKATPSLSQSAFSWYPQTEFCYMRNNKGFFLAAKGGYNSESHNHNDVGTFLLYLNNRPVFIDVGVGTYTRQTFSDERYTIWTMQSDYHNLPRINGISQQNGFDYRSKNVRFDDKKMQFSLDISGAYPAGAGISVWNRSYTLPRDGGLILEDNFILNSTLNPNQVNFMTLVSPDITTPGVVKLLIDGEQVNLTYDSNLFKASAEPIKQTDSRLSAVWGDNLYRLTLNALTLQKKGKYRFTVNINQK
jgi:hypothetical protein